MKEKRGGRERETEREERDNEGERGRLIKGNKERMSKRR